MGRASHTSRGWSIAFRFLVATMHGERIPLPYVTERFKGGVRRDLKNQLPAWVVRERFGNGLENAVLFRASGGSR